jgi:cellulose synthase/poly-beta-1,6-N-acetylglucosamine synthase-like glycosyltransferase
MAIGFVRSKFFYPGDNPSFIPVTIIICARNEEKNIVACLSSILAQDYDLSKIQILLVNDASTDQTLKLAENILSNSGIAYNVISNNRQLGKKQSISNVIPQANHELIVTRDADTLTQSPKWLRSIAGFYSATQSDLIIGPVSMHDSRSFLSALQAIENNVLTVLACGSAFFKKPFLCSGANLAFTRTTYARVNGYDSHLSIPSGDDVLFLEDVKKIPGVRINYLKSPDAIVSTFAARSLRELFSQKVRWAGKFRHNRNWLNGFLAFLVFAVNAFFLLSLYKFITEQNTAVDYFLFIILKLCIDILLLFLASSFINNKYLAWFVLPVAFLYPPYACIISIASVIVKPKWKP